MREGLVQLEKRVDQQNSNLVMSFSLVLMWKALLKVLTGTIRVTIQLFITVTHGCIIAIIKLNVNGQEYVG